MAYVSLYRRYRPHTFAEVVGQEHVTRTLANALTEDRLSHAYLFTGPRGTGKTSTARILAAAINCDDGPTATPCGACEHCTSIADGTAVDVIELDMASHGGVDDARELRDRALFAPARARRKVYILDEVHMASTAAFNALLKLIEEPPAHVLFAMATTDPQKVIPTILSRVQRLDLRRVPATEVAAHVRWICTSEGATIEDGAVDAVVRAGDGSVRDTLSVLEQVLSFAGQEVTTDAVALTLGASPAERLFELVDHLAARDLAAGLALVQRLLDDGHDLRRFTLDLVQHLRDLLVLQVAPDDVDLVDATDEHRRRLLAQTSAFSAEEALRMVAVLAETVTEQRQGTPRLPLELALARLAVPGADGDVAALAARLAVLEAGSTRSAPRVAADPVAAASATPATSTDVAAQPPDPAPAAEEAPSVAPGAAGPKSGGGGSEAVERARARAAARTARPASEQATDDGSTEATADEEPDAVAAATEGTEADGSPEPEPQPEEPTAPAPSDAEETVDAAQAIPSTATPEPADADQDTTEVEEETALEDPVAAEPAAEPAVAPVVDEPTPGAEPAAPEGDAEPLEQVSARWDGILELLKQRSRRHHAIFEPAVPVALRRGILTLRYAPRYASFHAVQARGGELSGSLVAAIEQACGLRVKIDVEVEGAPSDRRPVPPSVTPDDARTPVFDRDDTAGEGAGEEGLDVREAEQGAPPAAEDVARLLQRELGAELLDERPPPETGG